jgi:hypothetical protein
MFLGNRTDSATAASETSHRLPRLWPFLLVLASAAICLDLSAIHQYHSSDSLLPVLVSLQHWTPFFWLQDRVGMLVPLVAIPLRHPFANLLVQDGLYIFSGLTSFLLLARYVLPNRAYALVGIGSASVFVALAPPGWCFNLFINTFYGVWLALGLAGLVLLDLPGRLTWIRLTCALTLLVLAHWAYTATALLLGPLVVCRALFCGRRRSAIGLRPYEALGQPTGDRQPQLRAITALLLLTVALTIGLLLLKVAPEPTRRTPMGAIHMSQWPSAWRQLVEHTWSYLSPRQWPYLLLGAAGASCLLLFASSVRRQAPRAMRAAAALATAALLFGLFLGTRRWVTKMTFSAHYTLPVVFFLQMAIVVAAIGPLCTALPASFRKALSVLAAPALLAAVLFNFGSPSLQRVRDDIDHKFGKYSADLVTGKATHFAGGYWNVWPAVFHANLLLYEQQVPRTVWGLTYRGEVTQPDWQNMPPEDVRVAVPAEGDRDANSYLSQFGLADSILVERLPTITVLQPEASGLWSGP